MSDETFRAIALAVLGPGGLVVLWVTTRARRKAGNAEATAVEASDTATAVAATASRVERAQEDLEGLFVDMAAEVHRLREESRARDIEALRDAHERDRLENARLVLAIEHERWDRQMVAKLRALDPDSDFPDPPAIRVDRALPMPRPPHEH